MQPKSPDRIAEGRAPASFPSAHPTMRSFVKRSGRTTRAQTRALETHWARYGVEEDALGDPSALFGDREPLTLEIGFGSGENLVRAALENPGCNYLGVEIYEAGLGRVLEAAHRNETGNLRVVRGDAVHVLEALPDRSLAAIWIFFPDPWPKKRHHKRRLVNRGFARTLQRKLVAGGRLLLATDWEDYARHMLDVLEATPGLDNQAGTGNFAEPSSERVDSRFARRARRLGHRLWDLSFIRVG